MSSSEARPGPIVVGVERSERSRDALALGRTLAHAAGAARLLLVSVYPIGARSATVERAAYARALHAEAEAALDWVATPICGDRPEVRALPSTSIARGLHQTATTEGALAIVVGTSHRGPFGRIVPGSVGERLLRGAACPVAVATGPRNTGQDEITRIGVGYVATPEGDEALRAAAGLAAHTGAEVRVLSVIEPSAASPAVPFGWDIDGLEATAREQLASAILRATVAAPGPLQIAGEVADGYADDELARLSREVDLLVCGSSGRRPIGGFKIGSVPAGILRKARCPLLIVPRDARNDFAGLEPFVLAA